MRPLNVKRITRPLWSLSLILPEQRSGLLDLWLFAAFGDGCFLLGAFLGRRVIDRNMQGGVDLGGKPDGNLVFAEFFDRLGEIDFFSVDFVTRLLELVRDVLAGDGAEDLFLTFTRFKNKDELEFAQLAGKFLGFVQLAGFALGALALEFLHLALGGEGGGSGKIFRNEKIAGVTGLDRDDIGFAAQAFDFGFKNNFDGHKERWIRDCS